MDIKKLETFIVVARLKSFIAASELLHLTQPAISTRIANFEHELNCKLFNRVGRTVELTPKGREILSHAIRIVEDAQSFRRLAGTPSFLSGRVRIGSTDSFVRTSLDSIITRMARKYPDIAIDLIVSDSTLLWSQLLDGEVDVGFIADPMSHAAIRSLSLFDTRLVWVAKREMFPESPVLSVTELVENKIFVPRRGSFAFSAVLRGLQDRDTFNNNLCGIGSIEAAIRLTEAGLGIGVFPLNVIEERISAQALAIIDVAGFTLPDIHYKACHRTDTFSDAGRILADTAEEVICVDFH